MPEYDVIVIGTGIGGLICAAILSNAGMNVLCLEKNFNPGGYLTSFKRKGFLFDSSVDCISGTSKNGLFTRVIDKLGLKEEIEFITVSPIRYSIFPDHSISVLNNIEQYKDELCKLFPGDCTGVNKIIKVFEDIYINSLNAAEALIHGDYKVKEIPDITIKASSISYLKLLDDYIYDNRLKAILSDRCPFIGLPPGDVSALSMVNLIMSYFRQGTSRVRGGYQRLSDRLSEAIRNHGSKVLTGKFVKRMLTKDNKVVSVLCDTGEQYSSKYIVSNADFFSTAAMLNDSASFKQAQQYIENPGCSISFFIVYLGVKGINVSHSSIGYYPSYDMERFFQRENYFSDKQTLGVTVATVEEPERAPVNCHTVVAHEMVQSEEDIKDRKKCIELVIKRLEKLFPTINLNILTVDSATPRTLYRYTGNYKGAAFGWRQIPKRKIRSKLYFDNLYIAGHWGSFGGGVLAAGYSGVATASQIILKEGGKIEL